METSASPTTRTSCAWWTFFRGNGMAVAAVVITQYAGCQPAADAFRHRLASLGIQCAFSHYPSRATPTTWTLSSPTGATARTSTWRPPVRSWWLRPRPRLGKLAACLSQIYHEHKRGVGGRLRQFETFPV